MSVPAPVEAERQLVNKGGKIDNRIINFPTSPAQVHERAVQKISDNLTQAGHAQPLEQVSAQGGAEAVLSRIKEGGIATVDEGVDVIDKMIKEGRGVFSGFDHNYTVNNPKTGPEIIAKRKEQKAA